MKEEHKYKMANAATGCVDCLTIYRMKLRRNNKVFNLQLRYWVEALMVYQELDEHNFVLEDALLVIHFLCNSLETLAGVNIKLTGYTPALLKLYEKTLAGKKGWDLKKERKGFFNTLKEMDNYNNNICKHINRSDERKELLEEISYRKIYDFLEAAKGIWLWMLDKVFNGNIPKDQLLLFNWKDLSELLAVSLAEERL